MLSTRGAITTNVALVECAAGQNKADASVFLLSELEKVWVAVAVVARRLLLDGRAVQVSPFGALWTEEYVLLRDRQQRPYTTRKLCFGIHLNYANRYGIDTGKVPLEKSNGVGCVRVSMADIVAVCGVPARTAAAALREFFMYLGEGLSRGRIFQLAMPGVATIAIKQQKVVLTMNDDLRHAMYEIDSRKWAVELREEGLTALAHLTAAPASGVVSAQSSRPSTSRASRVSWRPVPAPSTSAAVSSLTDEKKAVFIAAAPSGRTFDEIAQQAEQRRKAAEIAAGAEREMRRRQEDLDRRIEHYYYYYGEGDRDEYHADPMMNEMHFYGDGEGDRDDDETQVAEVDEGQRRRLRPPSASGESIYNVLADHQGRAPATSHQYGLQPQRPHAPYPPHSRIIDEPEVEVIEMVGDEHPHLADAAANEEEEARARRPLAHKDAELERVLREEEPFSRPISRRTYHETCAARDLIYAQPLEAPERVSSSSSAPAAAAEPFSVFRPSRKANNLAASAEVEERSAQEPTHPQPNKGADSGRQPPHEEAIRFGRKRFNGNSYDDDHVGSLLQYGA
ncbi:hypothetical protein ABB37_04086 [Leptomonas pyrrhocoris]|uniref:CCDC81 HU domain-containing protein n=1 Tax=Leptomonas pyrrhocoris TaxID=157538 RepID=A0A0N0VFS9_LEPPY|nr:hypothetical protein ABB37_04086 [Leptomonas pyrrhocoris]KPA81821.1 hypothetical protein ABB37_04086 [Leptomonas pyrrhocoris]|eukprot:XP_015660260.1 hypothetical protein ABB37_04086 [Leptomonas pyrrhocoris]